MNSNQSTQKPNPSDIRIGDQIAFWMFDENFYKRPYFGTVMEIGTTEIADEPRLYFVVAEYVDKKILCHQVERIIKKRQSLEQLHRKTEEVLSSRHIQNVEAGFEYEAAGIRYYSAITYDEGFPHRYKVRVWEDEQGNTRTKCVCPWGSGDRSQPCRHVLKVGELDAKKFNRVLHLETFASYQAHLRH